MQRGFAQHAANGASLCGDCAEAFTDGSGRYISVLSDGMGTGGRAAVDGTMTAGMAQSLLKAGIGFESTLKMINSAMLAKGGEESLATLDVACIDLVTGHVTQRKAGAAGTVLRRRKKSIWKPKACPWAFCRKSPLPAAKKTSMRAICSSWFRTA